MNTLANTPLTKQIADTTIEQLGGRRFQMMTGAKFFTYDGKGTLQFKLPGNTTKDRINHVSIALNGMDLYDITFMKVRGIESKVVATESNVYNTDLRAVFTRHTGLETSL